MFVYIRSAAFVIVVTQNLVLQQSKNVTAKCTETIYRSLLLFNSPCKKLNTISSGTNHVWDAAQTLWIRPKIQVLCLDWNKFAFDSVNVTYVKKNSLPEACCINCGPVTILKHLYIYLLNIMRILSLYLNHIPTVWNGMN